MSDTSTETDAVDKPYRIQTAAGYRKYLCSGLYMPSVTTVLSATETEKSKASLRTWQANNPGALEEASTRGSAIHLGCENYLRGSTQVSQNNIKIFGMESPITLIGLIPFIGRNVRFVPTGITSDLMIERWHMYGVLSTYMLVALT